MENLIINNQMKLSVNEIVNINFLVNDEVTKYDFNISSSNSNVVNVKNNQIIPLSPGEAFITFKEENTGLIKQIKILVSNIVAIDEQHPVIFNDEEIQYDNAKKIYIIKNGTSGSISLNLTDDTTYTNVIYSSDKEKIVSVGSDGTITAHKEGIARINMVCDDGAGERVEYQITIKVNKKNLIEDLSTFFYKVRKGLGHFAAFLILGIFSTLTYFMWFKKKEWVISLPLNFITGFYIAFLTEFIQRYVPGRSGNFNDVIIDMSGFLLSSIIITVLWFVLIIVKNKKKNSST
jgi:VanZ family protein